MPRNIENAFSRRIRRIRDREFGAMFEKGGEFSPEGQLCGLCPKPATVSYPIAWGTDPEYRCEEHRGC